MIKEKSRKLKGMQERNDARIESDHLRHKANQLANLHGTSYYFVAAPESYCHILHYDVLFCLFLFFFDSVVADQQCFISI